MPPQPTGSSARASGVPAPLFSAVVLAAGRSSRMGSDKALLEEGGQPLWRRQREVLAAAGAAEVFLSARDTQPWVPAAAAQFAAVVRDADSEAGPLAGIVAAFDRSTHAWLLVVAIDLAAVTAGYLQRLVGRAEAGRGAVPVWPDGRTEPLCALYPRAAAALAARRLECRHLKMQEFVAALEAADLIRRVPIAPEDAGLFVNWNQPGDVSGKGSL